MKAIVCTKYGSPDVLRLEEVAKPTPRDDEVLVKIHASSINARDWRMMRARPFFIRLMPGSLLKPKNKILGADVAGRVEAVGSSVQKLKLGDEVFGYMPGSTGHGTFAEYGCASETKLVLKPSSLTFEQAAAVPLAAITALQGLRGKGKHSAWTKGLDLWRIGWCRYFRRADRQSVWSGSHRGLQHQES